MSKDDVALMARFEAFLKAEDEKEQARNESLYEADFECDCEQCTSGWSRTG
jgi:hypothetical protein